MPGYHHKYMNINKKTVFAPKIWNTMVISSDKSKPDDIQDRVFKIAIKNV